MSPQSLSPPAMRSSKPALEGSPPPPDEASDMVAPSATAMGTSTSSTDVPSDPEPELSKVSVSLYVRELATTVCTVFEEAPAVGAVCKTLLSVEKLVRTAKVNKDELEVLLELCDVVTRGFLDRCSEPCVPLERVSSLRRHVESAKRVTALCNKGRFARFALGRKISKNITSVKTNVVNFATVNNLALSGDLHAKLGKMEEALAAKEREMQLAEEREKKIAEENEKQRVAERARQRADDRARKNAEGRERLSLEGKQRQSLEKQRHSLEGTDRQSLEGKQRNSFGGMDRESLEGFQRPSFEGRDRQSFEGKERQREEGKEKQRAEDEARASAAKTRAASEQIPVAPLVDGAKIPAAAPRIRVWYAERAAIVAEACDRLCPSNDSDTAGDANSPRIVGLAGPGGAGKSTVASMVVAREDVRVFFRSGILWLPVGRGANHRLPELMLSVAKMVYEVVLEEKVRPPLMPAFGGSSEDGIAYIREVVGQGHHRYLLVADDVCEPEVLEALKNTGAWVLYTSRNDTMLPEPPIRLNEIFIEEAALVMHRSARLPPSCRLPNVTYTLMERCNFNVMDLAFIGSWGAVHGRTDAEAWRTVLSRIADTCEGEEGGPSLPWRTAVLHAGLDALEEDDPNNKELYLCLAVIPRRLGFAAENAAALLFGEDFSADDLKAATHVLATLERWSILALDGEGKYHLHEVHAEYIQELRPMHQDAGIKALQRWQAHISSVRALLTWSDEELVDIWNVFAALEGTPVAPRPYDAALEVLEISDCRLSTALRQAGHFHWLAGDPAEACKKWTKLLAITEEKLGGYHPHVADTLQHLGECALVAGRTKEAEGLYRRALGIRAENLGPAHPLVTHTQRCLELCTLKQTTFPAVPKKPVAILVTGVLLVAIWGQRLARNSSR